MARFSNYQPRVEKISKLIFEHLIPEMDIKLKDEVFIDFYYVYFNSKEKLYKRIRTEVNIYILK